MGIREVDRHTGVSTLIGLGLTHNPDAALRAVATLVSQEQVSMWHVRESKFVFCFKTEAHLCFLPKFSLSQYNLFFFLWPHRVLAAARGVFVEARGIFCCGMQALRCGTRASL